MEGTLKNIPISEIKTILGELILGERDPQETFEIYQDKRIREGCLKCFFGEKIQGDLARWFEMQITILVEAKDDFAKKMLFFYVSQAEKGDASIFAIIFMVQMTGRSESSSCGTSLNECLGLIAYKIVDDNLSEEYHRSMKSFLQGFLKRFLFNIRKDGYKEEDWICAEHALDIISAVRDYEMLGIIKEIANLLEVNEIGPSINSPTFFRNQNLVKLKSVMNSLEK